MNNDFLVESLRRKKEEEINEVDAEKQLTAEQFRSISDSVINSTKVLIEFLNQYKPKTTVENFPSKISTPDVEGVVRQLKSLEKSLKPIASDNSDVIKSLKDVEKQIKELPKKIPVSEAVSVTNLEELKSTMDDGFKKISDALSGLEMNPKITVPKAQVNVEKTNLAPLTKEIKKVAKEVREKPITPVSVTPTDPLIRFTPVNMDDSTTVQYYSYIATSGEFYIRKVDKSGAYTTIRFYWGNGGATIHDTAWTGRAGLTYTMWSQ